MIPILLCITCLAMLLPASTMLIKRVTGASGSQTLNDITSALTTLNTFDAASDGTSHPVQIPASSFNYSYWASVCMVCSVAPPTEANNLAVYSDGTNNLGTGVDCNWATVAGTNGSTTTNYTQATGTPGATGLEAGANYGHSITTPISMFTYTAASPLALGGTFTTGVDTPSNSPTGRWGNWLIEQLTVTTTASAGVTPSETVTFVWDEF